MSYHKRAVLRINKLGLFTSNELEPVEIIMVFGQKISCSSEPSFVRVEKKNRDPKLRAV